MTFRDLINEVLVRLREDTIPTAWTGDINTSDSLTDYQKLVGSLVNDAKKSAEGQHDWLVLRETFSITTIAGTMQYTLGDSSKGAGSSFKVLDVINEKNGSVLTQANSEWLNKKSFPTAASGEPTHYAFNGISQVNSNREPDMNVDLYPVPDSVQVVNFNIVGSQSDLKKTDDVIRIPYQPIILGAWARAIAERGEDGGIQNNTVIAEAVDALNNAVQLDAGNTEYERDWYVG